MAELVAAVGVPHNPLVWEQMVDPMPDDLVDLRARWTEFRERLAAVEADTLVVVSSDHFRKWFYDSAPAFTIGNAERFPITYENETRTFGIPEWEVAGDPELASHFLGTNQLGEQFDFAWSNEWLIDHSISMPLAYLTPEFDIPIVPINTNANMPPIPTARRYAQLGAWLRGAIEAAPFDRRVVLIASGHLALDLGGPKQFLGGPSPDADFDRDAVAWMASGDLQAAIAGSTFDRLAKAGNVTLQFLNFLVTLAAANRPATFAEGTICRFAPAPFFWWDLQ